jgi:hypothetical protein
MKTSVVDKQRSVSEISEYRALRERAEHLVKHLKDDLAPFWRADRETFFRTPASTPAKSEVNVTTTCSCVMALALTGGFEAFFKNDKMAEALVKKLVGAPWMSSGLRLNNAFTTSLVIRAIGFLKQYKLLAKDFVPPVKDWCLSADIGDSSALLKRLNQPSKDASAHFIYNSLTDRTREMVQSATGESGLNKRLISEARRIAQSGWILAEGRFPSAKQVKPLGPDPTSYDITQYNYRLLETEFPGLLPKLQSMTLLQIAAKVAEDSNNFSINNYPASPAVVYWFVDGVTRCELTLEAEQWTRLVDYAKEQFSKQISLVVAENDLMMDPVAMAMAACLCAKLRRISKEGKLGVEKRQFARLPSQLELDDGIRRAFAKMLHSGIWAKYFPMFHYEDQGAGSNYCFSFELLEAVLSEFGNEESRLLDDPNVLAGLSSAVTWCEDNRLTYPVEDNNGNKPPFRGWNSGGYIPSLEASEPESWATAVVHMFLYELSLVLSQHLQRRVKKKYGAIEAADLRKPKKLSQLLDIELRIRGEKQLLSSVLTEHFVESHKDLNELAIRRGAKLKKVSALLFGPPGTSKTEVTKAIATETSWPLLTINPSDVVKGSLEDVYVRVHEIFEDMKDLAGVIIFFDEMDALMFLTTVMLPKLAELHDRGQSMFFMATNHQDRFDPALKRAGRFDLLLCMGPPLLQQKLDKIESFKGPKPFLKDADLAQAKKVIENYKGDKDITTQLDLLTFGEFADLLEAMVKNSVTVSQDKLFQKLFNDFQRHAVLNLKDLDGLLRDRIEKDEKLSEDEKAKAKKEWIGRYYLDRNESSIH